MPRPSSDSTQVAMRIPRAWLQRADKLRPSLGQPGFEATRTDVLRAAMALGLSEFELSEQPKGKKP